MTVPEILAEIRTRKIPIRLEEGVIYLTPAAARTIRPELAAGIKTHRPEIVWLLERRRPSGDPWEIWLREQHWEHWRLFHWRCWTKEEDHAAA